LPLQEVARMRVLYDRVAAIDVHKDMIKVAVRVPGKKPGARVTDVLEYRTFYGVLQAMARELRGRGVTHVVMEASGVSGTFSSASTSGQASAGTSRSGHPPRVPVPGQLGARRPRARSTLRRISMASHLKRQRRDVAGHPKPCNASESRTVTTARQPLTRVNRRSARSWGRYSRG
jgi:hypothetical protein